MASESVRLFIAVPVTTAVRRELAAVRERLEGAGALRLRWVRPEGIHLTLKFLGETPLERVEAIEAVLGEACAGSSGHGLRLSGLGVFGGRASGGKGTRVLWAGLEGAVEQTAELAGAIEARLSALGWEREERGQPGDWRPHLTLARVPDRASAEQRAVWATLVERAEGPASIELPVAEVQLIRSELRAGGARYTVLGAFALGAAHVGRP